MINRRTVLQLGTLPLLSGPCLSACGAAPRSEDVARLIREGQFDAARDVAEKLVARGQIDGQMELLAGALALRAGDLTRAHALFAAAPADDTSQALFTSGLAPFHWLGLAALRGGGDVASGGINPFSLDPVDGAVAGRLSPDAFVDAKIEEARRVADASILSIQQSPGRTAMLDDLAQEDAPLYRCTGNFIAAERWLAMGDPATAHWFLGLAIGSKAESLLEFHIAKAELARLA